MPEVSDNLVESAVETPTKGFNFNKLQAVLCIAASAAVSIALIFWGVRHLL